jgi:2-octaprenyl-6-methoxyphenol hydroxylase
MQNNSNQLKPLSSPQVAILGAGPVGLACAILLLERNPDLSLELFDKFQESNETIAQGDERGIAISEGSKQLLESIGAWKLEAPAIHEVHISQRHHFGQTVIRREELQKDALGYIVRYKDIHLQLRLRLKDLQKECKNFNWQFSSTRSDFEGMPTSTCCIHAEGGLFHEQVAKDARSDYGQSALIGWVQTRGFSEHIAWERFTSGGPLALLPHHQGKNARNLVWCASPERVEVLKNLDSKQFLMELQKAFGLPVGEFLEIHDRRSYPLGLNIRESIINQNHVWIGNAAQTLHPVAGQGLNLGLRDAATLSQCLGPVYLSISDPKFEVLNKALIDYAGLREKDRRATIGLTDLMARVFATDLAPIVIARGLALSILQWIPPLKSAIARQMMFGQR